MHVIKQFDTQRHTSGNNKVNHMVGNLLNVYQLFGMI